MTSEFLPAAVCNAVRNVGAILLVTTAILMPGHAFAKDFIRIEVAGEIPPELRIALNQVIGSSTLENVIASGAVQAVDISTLCSRINCTETIRKSIEDALKGEVPKKVDYWLDAAIDRIGSNSKKGMKLPSVTGPSGTGDTYVLIEPHSAGYKTYRKASGLPAWRSAIPVAIPVYKDLLTEAINSGNIVQASIASDSAAPTLSATWFSRTNNLAVPVLQHDLIQFGMTKRQFAIAPSVSMERIARLIELGAQSGTNIIISNKPANEFEIEGTQANVIFEAGTDECKSDAASWPFDSARVAATLAFNQAILERMGIRHPRRTNILIIDSGLGQKLALSEPFSRYLAPDAGELLYAETYFDDISLSDTSKVCLDVDGNYDTSDAFGFAPIGDTIGCRSHTPLQRIAPIPKFAGNRSPPYFPGHGSFVGGLAVGGPDLIGIAKGLDRLIGLTFARITQMPEADNQSIKTEIADLKAALEFATLRGVDVINASLRVTDKSARNNLVPALKKFTGIVVAAAGNSPEKLSDDSSNFPAAVTGSIRNNGRLIVVGAIRRDKDSPWWPKSAYSKDLVDIAAPGVNLVSFNELGERVCMSGTSAAAPLVTFTAATLKALGMPSTIETRRRILATADLNPKLEEKVAGGRVLNVVNALDVFVDLVWLDGETAPRRAELLRADNNLSLPLMLQLCKQNSGILDRSKGFIDPAVLVYWRRGSDGKGELWHRLNVGISAIGQTCTVPEQRITFHDLDKDETETVSLFKVARIVPSPMRTAMPMVRK